MNEPPKNRQKATQQQRLSAALRENLKRRRAQAKERAKEGSKEGAKEATKGGAMAVEQGVPPHDSAGIAADKRKS